MLDILCIGHITKDCIITPQQTSYLPGGTAWYVGCGLNAINQDHSVSFKLLTAMAEADQAPVQRLREMGLEVECLPSPETLFFENKYGADFNNRQQRVLSQAAPFTMEQLQHAEARYFLLGSLLANDFPLEAFPMLHQKGKVVFDVQGYLREVRGEKVYAIDWKEKCETLRYVDILKVNEYEMEVLTGETNARKAALKLAEWGVKEVLLTFGSYGSLIYDADHKEFYDIPAVMPRQLVDATGCGDTYVLGYVFKRAQGASIPEAGLFAAQISARKLEASGPLQVWP